MKKKLLIGLLVVIAILAATNPTLTDFKSYAQLQTGRRISGQARTAYFGIFSFYKDENIDHAMFVGIFKNFFKVELPYTDEELKALRESIEAAKQDSIAAAEVAAEAARNWQPAAQDSASVSNH